MYDPKDPQFDAFQQLCREIDELVQHGVGVDPSNLASAIDDLIVAHDEAKGATK